MTEPTHRVGEASWDAWGDPAHTAPLTESQRELLRQVLGTAPDSGLPRTPESQLRLPPSALPRAARAALAE
ncbi:FAD-binding oxidoreductase, partial [Streptomonospora algeriensis]